MIRVFFPAISKSRALLALFTIMKTTLPAGTVDGTSLSSEFVIVTATVNETACARATPAAKLQPATNKAAQDTPRVITAARSRRCKNVLVCRDVKIRVSAYRDGTTVARANQGSS